MKKTHSGWVIPVIILFLLACNFASIKDAETKPDTANDKQQAKKFIDSINVQFSEEIKRGDSVALAAHYSSDAELLFANSEPIKGKDILTSWSGMINMGVKEMNFTTTDITVNDELLVETGKFEIFGDKNTMIDKGKYLVVWKKENGEWKLFRDMGNTSLPAPATK